MNIIIESSLIMWCLIYDYIAWLGAWFLDDQLLLVNGFWALWDNI
jgi:hypothetical protein